MKNQILYVKVLLLIGVGICGILACKKDSIITNTSSAVNMTNYFKQHPEDFSELSKILDISETASFLNAYGAYTFFAPDNNAIKSYLKDHNKNTVDEVSADEWKNFVKIHLLEDSVATEKFTDGKLPSLTMYGQYLITTAIFANGVTKYRINRQADIEQANISVGNGIVHKINNYLTPAQKTVAETLADMPRYTIFTEALRETGLYDSLNIKVTDNTNEKRKWLTVIAESDSALRAMGFTNYAALKTRYSNTGTPKLTNDSLHLWVNYHILYGAKYLADIIVEDAHATLAPQEVITAKLKAKNVLINDDVFNGIHEVGFMLYRQYSDVSAINGVIHEPAQHFGIKPRMPYPVYFDFCSGADFVKIGSVYQRQDYTFNADEAKVWTDVTFSPTGSFASGRSPIYRYNSASTAKTSYNRDVLVLPLGTSTRPLWAEFKTPLLIKGKYKIWIGYYTQAQSSSMVCDVQASIRPDVIGTEPELLSNARSLGFTTKRPGLKKVVNGVSVDDPDGEEAIGWKIYMESTSGSQVARLMGVADIKQTGRYWLRITAVNGSQNTNNLDMAQFIPIAMDQQYPRFKPDGSRIERPE